MKKGLIAAGVILILAVVVGASFIRSPGRRRGEEVRTEVAERREITKVVKASGVIDPRVKVNISAHVIAKIERLYVEEGDEIEAGAPFLELEKEAFAAARARAAAQLEISRSQSRQAEADLKNADLKRRRYLRLVEEGIVSPEESEAAELQHESARLRLEAAGEEVRRAAADLEKAEDDLSKVTIYAPIGGRVIALQAEEGEVVVSGTMNNAASVIGTIADLSEILAEVDVDETEIVDVELGQRATVEVDAIPGHPYAGRIVEVGSSGFSRPSQADVTFFKVKASLEDPDARLRPGMSARAEIEVATHADAVVVPIQAVVYRAPREDEEGGGSVDSTGEEEVEVVFVVEEGKAMQRAVETGLSDATHLEIVSGLAEGDAVVTGPYRTLRDLEDGDDVRPRAAEEDEKKGEGEES